MKKIWNFFDKYTSTILVVIAFLLCIIYTSISLIMLSKGVVISDTLTEWVFKFFGIELIALSGIKISKYMSNRGNQICEDIENKVSEINDVDIINEEVQ